MYAPSRRVNLIVLPPPNRVERCRIPSSSAPTAHTNFPIDKGAQLIQTNPIPPSFLSLSIPLYFFTPGLFGAFVERLTSLRRDNVRLFFENTVAVCTATCFNNKERERERTKIMLTESVRIVAGNSKEAHNLAFLFIEKLQSRKFKLDIERRSG